MVNGIKNDFLNYVYQQYLISINNSFNPKENYKSLEIESATKLKYGAIVENGKLVVDFAKLNSDYASKAFSKESYLTQRSLATVPESYFSLGVLGKKEFMKFVYERELLRSVVTFDKYSKSEDYAYRVEKLMLMSDSLPEGVKPERLAYEEFLRDNALLNMKNISFMFKDKNGFAKQISEVLRKHPELADKYPVLDSFYTNTRQGVTNLKVSELIMDSDTANEYHENISNLADTTIEKVPDAVDNAYISKLFSILPVFAFIQSGQGAKGQLNLGKIVPTTNLSNILSAASDYTLNNILNDADLAADYLEHYLLKFNAMYGKPIEDEQGGLPEDVSTVKPIMKNYYGQRTVEEDKTKFFQRTEYNPDVLTYNSKASIGVFKANVKKLFKEGEAPSNVIVTGTSSEKYSDYNMSILADSYNSTILKDMAFSKEISADGIRTVITKKKSFTNKNIAEDFLSDDTYESNVENIDKFINKLIEDRDVHKRKIYFDSKGIGNSLLGYAGDESLDKKNLVDGKAPAPKTFVYLSRRLYEEFGYVNPGLYVMDVLVEEGKVLRTEVVKKQTVTDDMVRQKFRECFKSLLGS